MVWKQPQSILKCGHGRILTKQDQGTKPIKGKGLFLLWSHPHLIHIRAISFQTLSVPSWDNETRIPTLWEVLGKTLWFPCQFFISTSLRIWRMSEHCTVCVGFHWALSLRKFFTCTFLHICSMLSWSPLWSKFIGRSDFARAGSCEGGEVCSFACNWWVSLASSLVSSVLLQTSLFIHWPPSPKPLLHFRTPWNQSKTSPIIPKGSIITNCVYMIPKF